MTPAPPAPPWNGRRRWHAIGRLQTRLFLWFLVAIAVSIGANSLTFWWNRRDEPPPNAMSVATRTIAARVAKQWDDPAACDAYLANVRELTGFDLHLRRGDLPAAVRHGSRSGIAFDANGAAIIPVVRDGQTVGSLEFDASRPPPRRPWSILGLVAGFVVLGIAARAVARRLALPLEDVAGAAERFGAGDMAARTHVGQARHFVAEEVRGVATAFDQMADRIARVVRDQRELLAAISHELRSPLGRARVALEIARDREGNAAVGRPSAPSSASSFDEIERQLADVDAILGDLLAAARAGLSDVKRSPTPLLAWLRARIASEPQDPPIELAVDEEALPRDVALSLDAPLMNRALHNVLANARAHGEGPIEVRVSADEARVVLLVRDRGPGFTQELLARAFDPFVKGDTARTPGSGLGLGLALVRRIAEAHGGRAFAGNVDGGGAEVGIELPRASAKMV